MYLVLISSSPPCQPAVRTDGEEAGDEEEKVRLGALLESTDVLPAKTWVGRVAM